MNRILHKITTKLTTPFLTQHPLYSLSFITDKLSDKQNKKAQEDFKREIEYMANKPTFTYMDYKQRVTD